MPIDETLIGKKGKSYVIEVEKGHIRRFAEAVGDSSPLYTDEEFAKDTNYKGLIAPPTFATTITMGQPSPLDDVEDFELRRVLHGEQEFEFHQPMRAGDKYHVETEITKVIERNGSLGKMTIFTIEAVASNFQEEPVVTCRSTIVYRQSL